MSLLFLSANENADDWRDHLLAAFPGETLVVWPEIGDPGAIEIAFVAKPPPGVLATLPNLKLIVSMWVGVDGILADPTFPRHVPLTRMIDPVMTQLMTESVCLHVLDLHRDGPLYREQAARREWRQRMQTPAQERSVGILGAGALGRDAAEKLMALGFDVACWSRSPKDIPGALSFAGGEALADFLNRTDILVSLLPLTDDTRGMIDHDFLAQLPRGAGFVNVARGAQVVDTDLIAALDSGHIRHAILDVFAVEPLPVDHPYWVHPKVTLLPHIAATSPPASCVTQATETVRRFRAGLALPNQVDFTVGY